jgi:xanthine dehydrogenase YagT iron-sulfur-binding subunit
MKRNKRERDHREAAPGRWAVFPSMNTSRDFPVPLRFRVNGSIYDIALDPRISLLDCLREHLHLTGTKLGCNQGACGACTVLLDGERINACLVLAVQCDGREITTIEGLGGHALGRAAQAAFVRHEAIQCGYCTPGQLCSAIAMLAEMASATPSAATEDLIAAAVLLSDEEIKERMAGNLCRCGAYNGITAAIRELAPRALTR